MTIDPRLLRAYRRTTYQVGDCPLRIGHRTSLSGVLITAWNPDSRRMPPGWNRRMQARLLQCLRRWQVRDASGGLGRWREDHVLVAAAPPVCLVLARRFRQRAIVILAAGRPARLVILPWPPSGGG